MEAFFSTLESEIGERFASHAEANAELFDYLEVFYNQRRRRSSAGRMSPAAFERTMTHAAYLNRPPKRIKRIHPMLPCQRDFIRGIVGTLLLCMCVSPAISAVSLHSGVDQPQAATASISGVVSDGSTGRPIADALIQLVGQPTGAADVRPAVPARRMTDGNGRFVFQALQAGSYTLRVTAAGYLPLGVGPVSEAGGLIKVQDGQWFGNANVALWAPAALSGTARDEKGEPLVDIPIRLLRALRLGGRDLWASGPVSRTDDRGVYRFGGLVPGEYVVYAPSIQITLPDGAVTLYRSKAPLAPLPSIRAGDGVGTMAGFYPVPPPGQGEVYAPTFSPAVRSLSDASVVTLDSGTQRDAVDISLVPVPAVRLSGIVQGPPGAIAKLPVRLLATGSETLGFGAETALTTTDDAGRFIFAQVPQGTYVLLVGRALNEYQFQDPLPNVSPTAANPFVDRMSLKRLGGVSGLTVTATGMAGDDVTGRISVSVGADAVEGLVVPTTSGVAVSGEVLFDGAAVPPVGRRINSTIRLESVDGEVSATLDWSRPQLTLDGATFSIPNVMPGRYWFVDQDSRGYRLVGATQNGRDLFDSPLEVTETGLMTGIVIRLSSKRNSISGVVHGVNNDSPAASAVLIFPQDSSRWRSGVSSPLFHNMDVSMTGTFSAPDLIPGDYFVAAVPLQDRQRAFDSEFLKSLESQATRVTLGESATLTVDLVVIRRPR